MIRKALLAFVVFFACSVVPVAAQTLDSHRDEAVRSRGFIRGAETQLTKVIGLIDRITVSPDGTVDTIFVGDTLYADDLVPDSAPPEWRVEEAEPDSTSPPWVGDGRQLYTYWAWGDSSAVWNATGDTLTYTWPADQQVIHIWPVFERGETLWVPSNAGWLPATVHPSRPWVCIEPGSSAEGYGFTEQVVMSGIKLGLKVADWTIGIDSTFARGLDRLPPECPAVEPPPADSGPPPMPTGVSLAGYVQGDQNGLLIMWNPAPAGTDSVIVAGGRNAGGGIFTRLLPGTATEWRQPLAYDTVTSMWICVKFKRDGINGPQRCNSFNWAPM